MHFGCCSSFVMSVLCIWEWRCPRSVLWWPIIYVPLILGFRLWARCFSLETVRALGVILEQLNFSCEYLHDDLPDQFLPTRQVS